MNTFYHGDCLLVMRKDIPPESVDLIYLDPPFFTGKVQKGKWQPGEMPLTYDDGKKFWKDKGIAEHASVWLKCIANDRPDFAAYLFYMAERLELCKRVLKPTGSIYLHCDWRASHYLKMIMDEIFGVDNFQNEIVWHYRGRGMQSRRFQRKHDTIFYYSKNTPCFNIQEILTPLDPKHISRYNKVDEDGKPYALIKNRAGNYSKIYRKNGIVPDDVWDIPFIHGKEATGYPTQKPLALLERIILASSNEGDLVLDPFCGCGTAIVAAQGLGRQWLGIDINIEAYKVSHRRGERQLTLGAKGKAHYISRDLAEVKALSPNEFEKWVNQYYGAAKPYPDKVVDGITADGIPIQTKTTKNGVDSPEIHTFNSAISDHPKLQGIDVQEGIFVSQNGFTNRARQVVSGIEERGGIKIRLAKPEEMLK